MHKVGVSQKAIIFNQHGKFLVLLRGATAPFNPLKWDLPGGDVDFGEDASESILREIDEETGIKVGQLTLFDLTAKITDDGFHWFTAAYTAVAKSDDVKISWEHDEYKWVDHGEFSKLDSPPKIARFVDQLKGRGSTKPPK